MQVWNIIHVCVDMPL